MPIDVVKDAYMVRYHVKCRSDANDKVLVLVVEPLFLLRCVSCDIYIAGVASRRNLRIIWIDHLAS